MRRVERAGYPDIHRFLQTVGEDVSLRWVIRHFGRGHDRFSPPSEDTEIPTWLFEDEEEFERYMHQYGYCRTIDDLCPHIASRSVSTCAEVDHPECGAWRENVLRERVADLEATRLPGSLAAAAGDADAGRVALVEPLTVNQPLEIEVGGAHAGIYASAVVAIERNQLLIRVPTRLKETLSVAPGERLTIFYRGRVSKYGFETTVRAVHQGRVGVEPPTTVTIASRRSPRIPLRNSRADVERVEQGSVQVSGRGIDASIRGLRLVLPVELAQWERVRVTVHLPDGELTVQGEVVRVEPGSDGEFVHGIYFTG
ncbi:MAG TPA: flagellar brake protein, partial [bacterium]|nr:flagellar brake protein [bacterium]